MAVPSLLNVALGLLIVGNGFFKPNTSSMVGMLYPTQDDPRRAGGYTIFYMGINLGAFFSPFIAGTLGEKVGWHWGFASAGVGMALGLINFLMMQKHLGRAGLRDDQESVNWKHLPAVLMWTAGGMALVYVTLAAWQVVGPAIEGMSLLLRLGFGTAVVIGILAWTLRTATREEVGRVVGIAIVSIFVVFFWMGFEQAGGSMNLFADKQTDRHLLGWEIPASWFQSINPVIIVALGPVFAMLWTWLNQTRWALSDSAKQGWGMVVLGLGFVVMAVAQSRAREFGSVGPLWLAGVYLLHTLGELMLSPVGLSMVSRVAPVRLASLLMGTWFMSSALSNYLAGSLETLLNGTGVSPYVFLIGSSMGAGVLLLMLSPWLSRLMREKVGTGT
jgi:POT family proton-dependent oligopeptide transporter